MAHADIDVCIIGAGVAGLACAGRLLAASRSVSLLEASSRYGGRVWTEYGHDRDILELGATWLHSSVGNPLYDFAAASNLLDGVESTSNFTAVPRPLDASTCDADASSGDSSPPADAWYDASDTQQPVYVRPRGTVVPSAVVAGVMASTRSLLQRAHDMHGGGDTPQDDSVGDFLSRERGAGSDDVVSSIAAMRVLGECVYSGAPRLSRLSLRDYGAYFNGDGENSPPPRGFMSIVDTLARPALPFIRYRHRVVRIDGAQHGFLITCENGVQFRSKHVVWTGSLGVLQARAQDLFYPALPPSRLATISRMGFGRVEKVHLEYDSSWWRRIPPPHASGPDAAVTGVVFLWDAALTRAAVGEPAAARLEAAPFDGYHSWMASVFGAYEDRDPAPPTRPRLTFWLLEDAACVLDAPPSRADDLKQPLLPTVDDATLAAYLTRILSHFLCGEGSTLKAHLPPEGVPAPVAVVRSRWGSNPDFRGSYTYVATGASVHDMTTLATPLGVGPDGHWMEGEAAASLLCFAGEATHSSFFSTTHGAYATGLREAERLLAARGVA